MKYFLDALDALVDIVLLSLNIFVCLIIGGTLGLIGIKIMNWFYILLF